MPEVKPPTIKLEVADVAALAEQLKALILVDDKKIELYNQLIDIHRKANNEVRAKRAIAKKFLTVCRRMINNGKVDMKKLRFMSREYTHIRDTLNFEEKLYEKSKDIVPIYKRPS